MARLLVFRLVPETPVSPTDFAAYLTDGGSNVLIVEAYDVSFAKLSEPLPLLGRAIFVPDVNSVISGGFPLPNPPQPIPASTTTIAQHRRAVDLPPTPGNFTYQLQSVATAAVVITPPSPEFDGPDVVVKVKWGSAADVANAKLISTFTVDYNEATFDIIDPFPPTNPAQLADPTFLVNLYQNMLGSSSVAAYIPLVDPRTLSFTNNPVVTIPKDGSPPNFAQLLAAINQVVAADPGGLVDPKALTPAQARHVSFEIVWNRHIDPLPAPPSVTSLENMFTAPTSTDADNDRAKFQGALAAYSGTKNATAEGLAKYVFAVSAALAAQDMSAAAAPVRFELPVRPDVPPANGRKIKEVEVALDNP